MERIRVLMFFEIAEDHVKLTCGAVQRLKRVTLHDADAVAHAGTREVAGGSAGIFRIRVRIVNGSAHSGGTSRPDGGVTNGRAHLEDALRAADADELEENPADNRADNGDA